MIDAHRIVWQGLDSLEFDVTAHCSFGRDGGTTSSFLNRDNIYTEHYDGRRTIHRSKYVEAFTPRFTLIKQDFSDFDEEQNRKILSWLTASDKPGWLEVYRDDSNVLTWQCFGNIIGLEQYKLSNGRVVGYEFEMETTHPYAFSRKMELTKAILEPTTFNITSNSDEYTKSLYPTVTIKFKGDIYIPIKNMTEVQLLDTAYTMIPNTIYALYLNNTTVSTYYINIPSISYRGIIHVGIISLEAATPGEYYCVDGKTVVQKVAADDNQTYIWKTVAEVGAAVQIENTTLGISTVISGAAKDETIILDGMNKVISVYDVNGNQETRIIGDHFNWEWLPLHYGDNSITITGNCEVTLEWIEPRKVGDM